MKRTRLTRYALAAACALPVLARAQGGADGTRTGPVINAVQIKRENVFDVSESSSWLARGANGLHIVTRERIVARELLVKEGTPFDSASAAESARNLRKLGIFREVTVDSVRSDSGLSTVITTRDSWTTQPYLTFKTVGSQVTWGVGATEKNLLGLQISATLRYINDPDRSSVGFAAILPKMWKDRLSIGGGYASLSDGTRARFMAEVPFFSLASTQAMRFDYEFGDRNIMQFFDGQEDARDTLRQNLDRMTAFYKWAPRASPNGYLRMGSTLEFRREDYTPLGAPVTRSIFGELEFSGEATTAKYSVVREYRNLGSAEDVDLSPTVRVGVWVAPSAWGYDRTGLGPNVTASAGWSLPKGFATAKVKASGLFNADGLDSGTVTGDFVLALRPVTGHSLIVGANLGWDKNPFPGEEFDLGSSFGPRAYPLHAFTGDRMFHTSAEYRFIAMENLWSLFAVGFAGFADYGGAWYSGSPRRTGSDFGVGLRLASIRGSSGGKATRIDFAHRSANDAVAAGWVVVVGAGFSFDRPQKVARQ